MLFKELAAFSSSLHTFECIKRNALATCLLEGRDGETFEIELISPHVRVHSHLRCNSPYMSPLSPFSFKKTNLFPHIFLFG